MVSAVASFAGGSTSQGRALALLFFALAGLGLFGLATDRLHIDLDIRTRPRGRPLAVVVTGTLAAAIVGGFVTNSAFDARYASVVFIPLDPAGGPRDSPSSGTATSGWASWPWPWSSGSPHRCRT